MQAWMEGQYTAWDPTGAVFLIEAVTKTSWSEALQGIKKKIG